MTDVAVLISDMVRAGVDPDLIGRTAAALADRQPVPLADTAAERRRAKDRERKRLRNSAESAETAELKKVSPDTPFEENQPPPKDPLKGVQKVPPSDLNEALGVFNALAEKTGWPQASKLTPGRASQLRQRLAESGGLPGWRAAIERAGRSPFLRGETGRSAGHEAWRPDFDWLLKAGNFTKLIEGGYDGRKPGTGPPVLVPDKPDWDARARYFQRNGWLEIWGDERDIPPEHRPKFVRLADRQHQGAA